jgi:outer membrane beta-barrel protein
MRKNFLLAILIIIFIFPTAKGSESDVYDFSWLDPDKEIFVLQNRKFKKAQKFFGSAAGGMTTSGAFVDATSLQGRIGFFFTEQLGIEGIYSKNSGKENSTAQSVRNPGGVGSIPYRRIVEDYQGALFVWSPFYAKINTFNKIVYFDWSLALGYGKVNDRSNRDEFNNGTAGVFSEAAESHNALMWGTGIKFYLTEHINVRLDFTAIHYKAQRAERNARVGEDSNYSNFDLTAGLEFRL